MNAGDIRSVRDYIGDLRAAPSHWFDTAIVVAFHDRFEFVRESCSDAPGLLRSLESSGGLAIGLAGMSMTPSCRHRFLAKVFPEYEGQAWTHRRMDALRRIVSRNGS